MVTFHSPDFHISIFSFLLKVKKLPFSFLCFHVTSWIQDAEPADNQTVRLKESSNAGTVKHLTLCIAGAPPLLLIIWAVWWSVSLWLFSGFRSHRRGAKGKARRFRQCGADQQHGASLVRRWRWCHGTRGCSSACFVSYIESIPYTLSCWDQMWINTLLKRVYIFS